MKIYTTDDLLHLIIRGNYGGSVSEQFSDTWNDSETIEDQNPTAMGYIKETMQDLLDGEFFSDNVNEDIKQYLDRIGGVNSDDEDDDELNEQKNNFQPKKTPGLNEDVFHVKMGRFTITESEKERIKGLYEEHGKESYFARHGEKSKWVGSSNKTYDNLPDGDYDDEDYDDFDSLHKSRPDFHKHYSGGGGSDRAKSIFDTYRKQEGPLKVKKRKG